MRLRIAPRSFTLAYARAWLRREVQGRAAGEEK
jgi:hypothetical protein